METEEVAEELDELLDERFVEREERELAAKLGLVLHEPGGVLGYGLWNSRNRTDQDDAAQHLQDGGDRADLHVVGLDDVHADLEDVVHGDFLGVGD